MIGERKHTVVILLMLLILPVFAYFHITVGLIDISFSEILDSIFEFDPDNINHIISREIRVPRMIMAIIAGAGLSICGLLMQTLFNNPLAGPYVLGITSGSSLFVALSIMTGIPILTSNYGIVAGALIGAFIFGVIILLFSLTVRSHISLLLIGLMLGSFTSAIVYIIQTASDAHELKAFAMWSMGSLQNVGLSEISLIVTLFLVGLLASLLLIKPLNILVIGENEAKLLGINYKTTRLLIILITAILTGIITAHCGPIAFVGLAVPNMIKILFKTQNHLVLLLSTIVFGSIFLLSCDIVIQLFEESINIPINAITSIIGAPFIVLIVLKRLA